MCCSKNLKQVYNGNHDVCYLSADFSTVMAAVKCCKAEGIKKSSYFCLYWMKFYLIGILFSPFPMQNVCVCLEVHWHLQVEEWDFIHNYVWKDKRITLIQCGCVYWCLWYYLHQLSPWRTLGFSPLWASYISTCNVCP